MYRDDDTIAKMTLAQLISRLRAYFAPFTLVPFNRPNGVMNKARVGPGQDFILASVTANVDVTITHNLGKVPSGLQIINPGTTANNWYIGSVAATTTTLTVRFTATATNVWVWVF